MVNRYHEDLELKEATLSEVCSEDRDFMRERIRAFSAIHRLIEPGATLRGLNMAMTSAVTNVTMARRLYSGIAGVSAQSAPYR
jgi:hypothetical protein